MAFITDATRKVVIDHAVATLGRAPSAAELAAITKLLNNNASLADVADYLTSSDGYLAKYPLGQTAKEVGADILDAAIVGGVLAADIRLAAIDIIAGGLTAGTYTIASATNAVVAYLSDTANNDNADLGDIAKAFQNRTAAAEKFTTTFTLAGATVTAADLAAAVEGVTSDAATLTAATAAFAAGNKSIAAQVAADKAVADAAAAAKAAEEKAAADAAAAKAAEEKAAADAAAAKAAEEKAAADKAAADKAAADKAAADAVAAEKVLTDAYTAAAAEAATAIAASEAADAALIAAQTASEAAATKAALTDATALTAATTTATTADTAAKAAVVTAQTAYDAALVAGVAVDVSTANGELLIAQNNASIAAAALVTATAASDAATADDAAAATAATALEAATTASDTAAAAADAAAAAAVTAAAATADTDDDTAAAVLVTEAADSNPTGDAAVAAAAKAAADKAAADKVAADKAAADAAAAQKVIDDAAAAQKVIDDAAAAKEALKQTLALTTNTDVLTSGAGDDSFNSSSTTFNSDDILNGGEGTDTFTVTAAGAATVIGNLTDIENVRITNGSGTNTDVFAINMIGATGVSEVTSRLSSADASFTNVQSLPTVSAFGTLSGADITVTVLDTLASGLADSVSVKADAGAVIGVEVTGAGSGRFETINIESAGSLKNTVTLAATTQAGAKTFNVTGTADAVVALEKTTAKATLDASTATGKQTLTVSAGDTGAASLFYVETIKGGAADDSIDVTDLIGGTQAATTYFGTTNPKVIDGGEGTNTLKIGEALTSLASNSATAVKHSISNIAVIDQGANAAVDVSLLAGAQNVKITAASDAFGNATPKTVTLDAEDSITLADGIDNTAGDGLLAKLKDASGTADNITVTLSDSDQGITGVGVDANSKAVEQLTLVSAGIATAGNTVTAIEADNTATLTITGTKKLTVTAVELSDSAVTGVTAVIDASGLSGNLTLGSTSGSYKSTGSEEHTVTLGSGTNKVYAAATSISNDSVIGTTGTDTLYITEGNSSTALKTTITDIDVVNVTAIANDQTIDATNFSGVGKIQMVGTNTGSEDLTFSKLATGQALEIVTSTSGGNAQLVDTLTVGGATGVTTVGVKLAGADGTAQAALALNSSLAGVTITDAIVGTDGYFESNQVTVGGTASTAKVTSLTLAGGGLTSATALATLDINAGSNLALATIDATGLSSNLDIVGLTGELNSLASITLGTGNNTITVAPAILDRDDVRIDGGDGTDTVAFTFADATADDTHRPGITAEALSITASSTTANNFDNTLDLTDSSGIATIAVNLNGTDDDLMVTNASGTVALKLAGSPAATTNVVSVAGATGLVLSNTATLGATAPVISAANATDVTIKQGHGSNSAFTSATFAAATSVTVGGSDIDASTGVAYAGTVTVTSLVTAKATGLTIDSNGGDITLSNVTAAKLATVTVTGDNAVGFGGSATTTAIASFTGSAATGAITIAQGVDFTSSAVVSTGTGNDSITIDVLTEGGVSIDMGEKTSDTDTLAIAGANNMGVTVIDLSAADQISQLNGAVNAAVQTGVENITLSGLTGSFGATVTGSADANTIIGTGNADNIIAGEAADTITGGGGNDTIDISEATAKVDTLKFASSGSGNGTDTVTGFSVTGGDVLNFTAFISTLGSATTQVGDGTDEDTIAADDTVITIDNSANAIAAKDYASADFAELFASGGSGFLDSANATAGTGDFIVVIQGSDQTQVFMIENDSGAAIIASEVTLVGTLSGNATELTAANFEGITTWS